VSVAERPSWWPDLDELDPEARASALRALRVPLRLRYTDPKPSPRQRAFVWYPGREAFYGGAAGGGKSWALLMAALQYVDVPGYNALILRRTLEELELPNALIDVSHQWLDHTDARWNGNKHRWTFPSGATLTFGYIGKPGAETRYQSASFHFIGFDEVTAFTEDVYTYMFVRCRRPMGRPAGVSPDGLGANDVPLRVRSASNPGGLGHEWVKTRFINDDSRLAPYFPSSIQHNPHLDEAAYLAMFEGMSDPVTRERMLRGDWDVMVEGTRFARDWFQVVDAAPLKPVRQARYWDLAATEARAGLDPDYTVGTLISLYADSTYCVEDVRRVRWSSAKVEALVASVAKADGRRVVVGIEQEPGASGKSLVSHFQRDVLKGYAVHGVKPSGDKFTRAGPAAAAAEQERVRVVRASWLPAWLDELGLFTADWKGHDDQVDSFSGAFELVHRAGRTTTRRTRAQLPSTLATGGRTTA
jgi:predicted phage terminase large subunit-like protein